MSPPTPIETLDAALTFGGGAEISGRLSLSVVEESTNEDATPKTISSRSKERSRKDALLARRTSEILQNYKDFLGSYDLMDGDDGYKSRLSQMSSVHPGPSIARKGSSGSSNAETCLLRDFSAVPGDVELGTNDRAERRKYKLPPPSDLLQSKRVKTGVVTCFGLLAAIAVIVGFSPRVSTDKIPARENAPGWHSEAGYILEHEHGDQTARLPSYNAFVQTKDQNPDPSSNGEPVVENDADEEGEESEGDADEDTEDIEDEDDADGHGEEEVEEDGGKEDKGEEVVAAPAPINTVSNSAIASFDLRQLLPDKFKPLWLGSKEGWEGGSHANAVDYCKSIRGMELCSYSVLCPEGPGHAVMAGRRPVDFSSQGEQYAPVNGHENRWVLVGRKNGDPSSTCRSHEQLEGAPPSWGLSETEAREKKLHILCCNAPENRRV